VELHSDPTAPAGATRVLAVDGHDVVAQLSVPLESNGAVAIEVAAPERVRRGEARALLDAACELAAPGSSTPVLLVSDELVRYEARVRGFTGGLRAPLAAQGAGDGVAPDTDLSIAVGGLLPLLDVRHRRALFRGPDLHVARDGRGVLRVRLPRDTEVMAEPVAAAIDTALAVKTRFGRAASGIGGLSFDHGGEALATGAISGLAEGASGVVVLTPNFVGADLLAGERLARAEAGWRMRPAPATARPFRTLDAVVAHECWHYLDAEIRVSGTTYIEFNAALGEALGVDTLEHALRGRERDAPQAWRAAHERLTHDVSAYAGTNPREASAEMFSLWWTAPEPHAPVVARFGELVERYFPR
ncbi:MAG TPA: hypothetical protein VFZ17_04985, partial [Acidimicrobiia bacterium]|nr:hypothetical protein [Acidimicrobiia bacterium]